MYLFISIYCTDHKKRFDIAKIEAAGQLKINNDYIQVREILDDTHILFNEMFNRKSKEVVIQLDKFPSNT
ncbi:MAG: hypothetical protein ACOCYF_02200 [Bacteroidota bacterium]